jgi:SAM-dependent methyltransferase
VCGAPLEETFVDLGLSPLANTYLTHEELQRPEVFFPLRAYVCETCLLVQLPMWETPEAIFSDYAYFSSYSESWVEHARGYVSAVVDRFDLGPESTVVEVASNDGYLLQFVHERGIPALGVEPAANVAAVASQRGIETIVDFFGARLALELRNRSTSADLIVANNVLAHVPDVHDFVEGLRVLLADTGVVTVEVPWLLRLIEKAEFDTIYHEHFSYFSFLVLERLFASHDLTLFDVEELETHGGSLRVYAAHAAHAPQTAARVDAVRSQETAARLDSPEVYRTFASQVHFAKRELLTFLSEAKRAGKTIAAYGAAAKGNTLLNYCGIRSDFVDYVVDRSPYKQGRYTPGTRLPIMSPDRLAETRPDYLLILAWNLTAEIIEQMNHVREWGCRFVVPIPRVEVVE